jgi:probable F420-dependent oxidoreductase
MRPFRFGFAKSRADNRAELVDGARAAEDAGYDVFLMADHLGILSPLPALAAIGTATERLRLGTFVLANDFRHPVVAAQEAATVDLLTDGRLELGMGAGWLKAEYDAAGWPFDPASERIERLDESVGLMRRLFAGGEVTHAGPAYRVQGLELSPPPPQGGSLPILIGGNGDKLLGVAGRQADIVGFTGFAPRKGGTANAATHWTEAGLADRIDVVRRAAGDRFDDIELNVLLQLAFVDVPAIEHLERMTEGLGMTAEEIAASPFVALGSTQEIADKLRGLRERLGVSYFSVFGARSEGFESVVAELV